MMNSEYSVTSIDILCSPFLACYGFMHLGNMDLKNLFLVLKVRNLGSTEYLTPILKCRVALAKLVKERKLRLLPWLQACDEVEVQVETFLEGLETGCEFRLGIEDLGYGMPNVESKPVSKG